MSTPSGGPNPNLSNVLAARACLPCNICKAIVPDRRKTDRSGNIHTVYAHVDLYPAYPALRSSAESGCGLCSFIRRALCSVTSPAARSTHENGVHPFWSEDGTRDMLLVLPWDRKVKVEVRFVFTPFAPVRDDEYISIRDSPPQFNGMVTAMWVEYGPVSGVVRDEDGRIWMGSQLSLPTFDSPDLESGISERKRRLPSSSTLSGENVVMMGRWIGDCANTHTECSVRSEAWLPTRLLEIVRTEDSSNLRLIETLDTHRQKGCRFAALSHMWGDMTVSPPLRALRSNYQQLKREIRNCDLPRNFADAVRVCVRLGIRYLWIDSICIIQDSHDDWQREASLMHLVYRHALVTIAATSATSCHDGFLDRNTDTIPAVKVAYSLGNGDGEPNARDRHLIICDPDRPQAVHRLHAVDGSKWNTRGWTMQERALSTRTLHFCRHKIFFECRGRLRTEENEPPQESDLTASSLWPRSKHTSPAGMYRHWEHFLAGYSQRNLTDSNDKLPAIQSVAEEMAAVTKFDYIRFAGMWRQKLQKELLWHIFTGTPSRPGRWRAPSWSWASLDAHFLLGNKIVTGTQRSVADSSTSRFNQHPFEVLGLGDARPDSASRGRGYLEIKSLTRRVASIRRIQNPGRWRTFFPYDLFVAASGQDGEGTSGLVLFGHGRMDLDGPDMIAEKGSTLLYIHVDCSSRATGLILEPQPDEPGQQPGSSELWRRVGIATLFADISGSQLMPDAFTDDDLPQMVTIV